ncbi:CAP domain-containing protein [Rhodovastum atsumiense]|uniref:CAP domain-containing protein n=1 Tax=Rhodovastum atsumiense TaxID=504468 RepID=A0A5M6IKR8_9PROT|nr:CAP domain-containing protein [Rhodovastum atsumiense]KAA5608158.1 CAP domain-containing protein [Rhodovastum atsumiense]CAH2598671.1 CAP domain-containing protein [Rhodovastum atsumiense]
MSNEMTPVEFGQYFPQFTNTSYVQDGAAPIQPRQSFSGFQHHRPSGQGTWGGSDDSTEDQAADPTPRNPWGWRPVPSHSTPDSTPTHQSTTTVTIPADRFPGRTTIPQSSDGGTPAPAPAATTNPTPTVPPSVPSDPGTTTPVSPQGSNATLEDYFLSLVNASRAQAGVSPLVTNTQLASAAGGHSDWMVAQDVFSHTGANGSSPGDRIQAAGYNGSSYGENIAYIAGSNAAVLDEADVRELHQNLMNSPPHRANLLNPDFTQIGIGLTQGDYQGSSAVFVTEDFGRPSAMQAPAGNTWQG